LSNQHISPNGKSPAHKSPFDDGGVGQFFEPTNPVFEIIGFLFGFEIIGFLFGYERETTIPAELIAGKDKIIALRTGEQSHDSPYLDKQGDECPDCDRGAQDGEGLQSVIGHGVLLLVLECILAASASPCRIISSRL
jgi:hypothetical protein